jgi:hypothetical protein
VATMGDQRRDGRGLPAAATLKIGISASRRPARWPVLASAYLRPRDGGQTRNAFAGLEVRPARRPDVRLHLRANRPLAGPQTSPLGLLPEQIDPSTGGFIGNFPQAFSHLGVVASGVNLARARAGALA